MSRHVTLAQPGRVFHAHKGKTAQPEAPESDVDQPDRALPSAKIATPITPRALREAILASLNDFAEDQRPELIKRRLTPLDQVLTTEQADALEQYATDEENFEKAGISRYDPEIIDTSTVNRAHIDGERHQALSRHLWVRGVLLMRELEILRTWCVQMNAPKEGLPAHLAAVRHFGIMVSSVDDMEKARKRWYAEIAKVGQNLSLLYKAHEKKRAQGKEALVRGVLA